MSIIVPHRFTNNASPRVGEPHRHALGKTATLEQRSSLKMPLRLWGLSATELHDAYWKSRGVQCLRMGQATALERADLYMLLRPGQLVLFDLHLLLNRLIWQGACMTTVHLTHRESRYRERTVMDDDGQIQRIERSYGTANRPSAHVHLTARAPIARSWMRVQCARDWRREARKIMPVPLVARTTVSGRCFRADCESQTAQMLNELVERWPDPERILRGLQRLPNGVRLQAGDPKPTSAIVGPVWIGRHHNNLPEHACWVGPAFIPDQAPDPAEKIAARLLHEVDAPLHTRRNTTGRSRDSALYPVAKRWFDVMVSALVLIASLPVLLAVSIAIFVDDGWPILFRHRRQTLHGRSFHCLKFRTMYNNAERCVADLRSQNLCDGPQVHIQNDPRVTRVGRFLRALHLDELPQLWNVLMGDMSLVGPRPSPDAENRICPAWRELRLSVRPGITGLWQIKRTRKPGCDFQEWIRYDVEYVHRAGFWLDVRICIQTIVMILTGRRPR